MTTQMFILGNSFIWSIEGCMTYNTTTHHHKPAILGTSSYKLIWI